MLMVGMAHSEGLPRGNGEILTHIGRYVKQSGCPFVLLGFERKTMVCPLLFMCPLLFPYAHLSPQAMQEAVNVVGDVVTGARVREALKLSGLTVSNCCHGES